MIKCLFDEVYCMCSRFTINSTDGEHRMKLLSAFVTLVLYCSLVEGIAIIDVAPTPPATQCLPQPVVQVPIQVQVRGAARLDLCSIETGTSTAKFSEFIEKEIIESFQSSSRCIIYDLNEVSCTAFGRRRQRVNFAFTANLTCSNGCQRYDGVNSDQESQQFFMGQVSNLRSAMRTKSTARVEYRGSTVTIYYFRGSKGAVTEVCKTRIVGSIRDKLALCECPEKCPDPCSLQSEPGLCRAAIPRFFHNNDTKQCESFTYGGCGGNQNNFDTKDDCEKECKVCPAGKVYQSCGTSCPETCDNREQLRFCSLRCAQGCFCPPGTVELGNECVAPEQCPTEATEEPTEAQCPEGKVFLECGTACPKTCDNKDELTICTFQCVEGCFCPPGTVELGDECVAPEQCPTEATEEPTGAQCPEGKVFLECGTSCPKTCDNKNELTICTFQCVEGCFCPPGTVELGNECVAPEQCPTEATEEPTEAQCPEGKVFLECGTSCPKTCDNKDELTICTFQCVEGCFCPPGTVELGDECVAPEQCPTEATEEPTEEQCPEGKVFQKCGTSCPKTCDNKDELTFCTLQCVGGCFCPPGMVELGDRCVPSSECPDVCTLAPTSGLCEAFIPSYFYNGTSGQCESFIYGGCGGNGNRFASIKDCKKRCVPVIDKCSLEPNPGPCKALLQKFFYNTTSEQCERFIYGGCQGNKNQFDSEQECLEDCGEPEVTVIPTGPQCPEGKVFQECGTACPKTCDNKDELTLCTLQCVGGCFCPEGSVLSGEVCVDPKECK